MRKFYSLMLTGLVVILAASGLKAQNDENKWLIGVGAHATDHTAIRPQVFSGYFDVEDYSIAPPLSRLSVARYLGKGLVGQLSVSVGEIDNKRYGIEDEFFLDADLGVQYHFVKKGSTRFDPYLIGTVGYSKYDYSGAKIGGYDYLNASEDKDVNKVIPSTYMTDEENFLSLGAGLGFNVWITDKFGVNLQSQYKHMPAGNADFQDYFHHAASLVFRFGAKDTDKDGIVDKKDDCPLVFGLKEFNGCPDTDGDKIIDKKDDCPKVFGLKKFNGCPDTDGDGVIDSKDDCPKIPGLAKFNGCPDTDGDGLADKDDECPKVAGPISNKGCPVPVVKEPVKQIVTEQALADIQFKAKSILFDTGKSTLKNASIAILKSISEVMTQYPDSNFNIDGHTDSVGRASSNQRLSERRAQAVVDFLQNLGVTNNLVARGFGETAPIDTNKTRAGRAQNRRTEITVR